MKSADDIPILTPEEDLLNHAHFAKDIAKLLASQKKSVNFVMSINGEWGSGKSSCVNMIKHYLENEHKDKIVYADFSPWLYHGNQEILLREFMSVLFKTVDSTSNICNCPFNFSANKLQKLFNSLLSNMTITVPFFGVSLKLPKASEPTIYDIKKQISDLLIKIDKKIVIFIDDLDRLNKSEVLQIFSLIKAVADFPNVIYVLSCDKKVLCDILGVGQGINGEQYLEKIVQLQVDLPIPAWQNMREMLLKGIDFGKYEADGKYYILKKYLECIVPIVNTPRKIKRFRQNFDIVYPLVKGHVFTEDFFALTFLRLFSPKSYEIIKKMLGEKISLLIWGHEMLGFNINESRDKKLRDNLFETLHEETKILNEDDWKSFMQTMFPCMFNNKEQVLQGSYKIHNELLRICSQQNYYINYFALTNLVQTNTDT